jgi:PQQ enzyme repeat
MRETRVLIAAVIVVLVVVAGAVSYVILTTPKGTSGPPAGQGGPPAATCATSAAASNWTTYHGDATRSGDYSMDDVTSATAAWSGPITLDGQIYAEPLTCGDVVYAATENDTVYAINLTSGAVIWHAHLGTPMPGSSLPCGDIDPSGITGTPVIDTLGGMLYVVAFVEPGHHELFQLSLSTGATLGETNVDPPGAYPLVEQQRGALALDGFDIDIPYGGLDGDCGQYYGFVLAEAIGLGGPLLSYQVPTQREAGIWAVAGPTVAPNGSVFVSTGNGASTTTFDFGDSVIELSQTLSETDYFAPTNWEQLNQDDTDLGSVAPTLLPNGDVFQIGKAGVGDLLLARHLGGIGGQLYEADVCGGGYGGTAHVGTTLFIPCTDGLYALDVNATNFTAAWQTSAFDAGSPIVTGNVVWTVDIDNATLLGFNDSTGAPLYAFPLGGADHFISPGAGANTVFVGGGDQLYGFRLG